VLDVVGRVVVGNELQGVRDALHEVGFTDHGAHGPRFYLRNARRA
jgi:hypothetical protein